MVGVGGGAAGDEPAQGAVDQRWEVGPEVSNPGQTLDAAMRRSMDTETHRVNLTGLRRKLHKQTGFNWNFRI